VWHGLSVRSGQTTQVDFRIFPGLAMMDGNWAALFAASDGKVYAGLAYNRRPYYSWQGYVFDAMAAGLDGRVYMGQAERKSKLYLYYPQ
jgi:hypothetical protein